MGSCKSTCYRKDEFQYRFEQLSMTPISQRGRYFPTPRDKGLIKLQAAIRGFLARRRYPTRSGPRSGDNPHSQDSEGSPQQFVGRLPRGSTQTTFQPSTNPLYQDEVQERDRMYSQLTPSLVEIDSNEEMTYRKMNHMVSLLCFDPIDEDVALQVCTEKQRFFHFIKMVNGGQYEGQWQGGKATGFGKYILPDGSQFTGEWQDNLANGKGTFQHIEGDTYRGDWVNNVANGIGKYTYPDGTTYEGWWADDMPHGQGKETLIDGSVYQGSFVKGRKQGQGELVFSDGSHYVGGFHNNEMHGEGSYMWADGKMYAGGWKRSLMHGNGKLKFSDGRVYEGQYLDDKKHGFGIFSWPDGKRYIGQWSEGLQHGNGEFINSNGERKKGTWILGKYQKQ